MNKRRYTSTINADTQAQVAKWHFELLNEGTINGEKKSPAFTRTDNYTKVAQGKVAPGTYGELPIIIDTTDTEVDLKY